jgi:hypothetical protein
MENIIQKLKSKKVQITEINETSIDFLLGKELYSFWKNQDNEYRFGVFDGCENWQLVELFYNEQEALEHIENIIIDYTRLAITKDALIEHGFREQANPFYPLIKDLSENKDESIFLAVTRIRNVIEFCLVIPTGIIYINPKTLDE